ncbi:MAG TPA: hypothetical protein VM686_28050 [Polyangiaceae bacterium]|nr:hypothetical protein [Polyangiaceae bacterium]
MATTLRSLFGLSILLLANAGCDGGDDSDARSGPKAVGGSSAAGGSGGTGGTAALPEGVPLTPLDGWVDGASNTVGIQGAMFSYADSTSGMSMIEDFTGANACITGTAAKVDMMCTIEPPATDCYGTFWGAAIGLNLNQPIDMSTMEGADPMPYDATALTGFAFEITGSMVPASLRFKVEDGTNEYCTPATVPVKAGANTVSFEQLVTNCWTKGGTPASGAKSSLLKVSWQVVTNAMSTVPFDFCVSNVRAME